MREFENIAELKPLVGKELGVSEWFLIDQDRINAFSAVTLDTHWLHTDPQRCTTEAPSGKAMVHGMLTLSLMTYLSRQIWTLKSFKTGVNYGYDRTRFLLPVHAGDRVRLRRGLAALDQSEHGWRIRFKDVMEIEGREKPACITENISIYQAT